MIRDRLGSLRRIQKGRSCDGSNDETVISLEGPIGDFLAKIDDIREKTKALPVKVAAVKRYHEDLLASPFNSSQKLALRGQVISEIKRDSAAVRARLLEIERCLESSPVGVYSRIMKIQFHVERLRFQTVMQDYNVALLDFSNRCKARLKSQFYDAGKSLTDDQLEDMVSSGSTCAYTHDIVAATRWSKLAVDQVETRFYEVQQTEKSIAELYELFTDLALLVQHQSCMVDDIEANVTAAQDFTEIGAKDTRKTAQSVRKKRRLVTVAVIVAVSVVLLVAVVLTFS